MFSNYDLPVKSLTLDRASGCLRRDLEKNIVRAV
jgi:hypothetical protein